MELKETSDISPINGYDIDTWQEQHSKDITLQAEENIDGVAIENSPEALAPKDLKGTVKIGKNTPTITSNVVGNKNSPAFNTRRGR